MTSFIASESYSDAEEDRTVQKWSKQSVRYPLTCHFTHMWGSLLLQFGLMNFELWTLHTSTIQFTYNLMQFSKSLKISVLKHNHYFN
jgi:hypothetical protein